MLQMFFPIQTMDIQVIHKHFKKFVKVSPKNFHHGPKKCNGCIFHAKSMTVQSNTRDLVIDVDLQMSSSAILIYQNQDYKSIIENHCVNLYFYFIFFPKGKPTGKNMTWKKTLRVNNVLYYFAIAKLSLMPCKHIRELIKQVPKLLSLVSPKININLNFGFYLYPPIYRFFKCFRWLFLFQHTQFCIQLKNPLYLGTPCSIKLFIL